MARGFMYLVAVMDWNSRFVLSWQLSNTMDTYFCLEALNAALHYGKPLVFNTDQGAQFTSLDFTSRLSQADIRISMDGRGRAIDNIFIERLWRSVKYEEIYLKDYDTVMDLDLSLLAYFRFYNESPTQYPWCHSRRRHDAHSGGYRPDTSVIWTSISIDIHHTLTSGYW